VRAPWPEDPPPGPFRATFWKSPLRGRGLTALLGTLLLVLVTIVAVTGFLSHAAYNPSLGMNAIVPKGDDLGFLLFDWPTSPSWLYALNQGLHVTVGFIAVPLLLAKLWSVIPRLFAWPPVESPAQGVERGALALLVGSSLFLFATGVANAQIYYPFKFNFVLAHYYAAIVFVVALTVHVAVKVPTLRRAYRERKGVMEAVPDALAPVAPDPPTLSRRGLLAIVGGASALLAITVGGQSVGGPFRSLALFAPRRQSFPVNKTARSAAVTAEMTGDGWRLQVGDRSFTRDELLAMPQRTESLPIACVEGWSTTQSWTGVRLSDLGQGRCFVESLQPRGALREATLSADQVADERSLLALKVNGEDLPLDHGYPARIIVPALPGVHNTKWVSKLSFS
jgi:DMSO/TMAO reductase YedYZ molybdopterin-dependent catalytic subunit